MFPLSRRAELAALAALLLAALAIRLLWVAHIPRDRIELPDEREYLELGDHLHSDQGLWFIDVRFNRPVYAYRTPGYPLFVSWCLADPRIVRAAQAFLDISTVLAIYLLSRKWLTGAQSLFAAAIVAFNPFLIFFTGLILSETLFTAMLCWGMVLLILSGGPWPTERGRMAAWIGGGVLLALSLLVRPGAFLLPVLLVSAAALASDFPSPRRQFPIPVAATMLLSTLFVLFPWAARNRLKLSDWVWTTTNAGITRYDGFNPDATGASDQSFVKTMPFLQDMTEVARSRYFAEKADDWLMQNPWRSVTLGFVKIGRTWSPIPLSDQYGSQTAYVLVGLCYALPVDLLLIAGFLRKGLPGPAKMFLLIPALYFTVGVALSVGSLRYLLPAEPPMAIVAAGALSRRGVRRSHLSDPALVN